MVAAFFSPEGRRCRHRRRCRCRRRRCLCHRRHFRRRFCRRRGRRCRCRPSAAAFSGLLSVPPTTSFPPLLVVVVLAANVIAAVAFSCLLSVPPTIGGCLRHRRRCRCRRRHRGCGRRCRRHRRCHRQGHRYASIGGRETVRNYCFFLRPGTIGPLESKKRYLLGGRKGMFLCSESCASGQGLRLVRSRGNFLSTI